MADPILQKWTCRTCGRSMETALPDAPRRCDECAGEIPTPPPGGAASGGERETVLARLRQRYDEVRAMGSPDEPHANLDRLIGSNERPGFEPADIDAGVAQVALLWLQDLARELDGEPCTTAGSVAGGQARLDAARGLRTATEDFAEAFLTPTPDPAASS